MTNPLAEAPAPESYEGGAMKPITFLNPARSLSSVALSWVDFAGKEVFYKNLEPGETYLIESYVGHVLVARVAGHGRVKLNKNFFCRLTAKSSSVLVSFM